MSEISYRQLQQGDYDKYREIRLTSLKEYPDNFGMTYAEEMNTELSPFASVIKGTDKNNFVVGAFASHDKLVGICGFARQTRAKTRHRGDLIQLFVDPLFARQGIGKKLIEFTIKKAFENSEIELITLGVINTNKSAIKLYKQIGFAEYGRMENYFKSGNRYFTQLLLVLKKE